jgi:transposase
MVPAEHPARVVDAVVDNLDISELEPGYKGGGTSSYDPRALLKVIIYSYLINVYSGRQMAKLWNENIVYMWLGGRNVPNFRTINNFLSRRLLGTFDSLFTQVVLLLHDEDLVSLKVQYVDGTKIESAANKYTFVWRKVDQTKEMEAATLCKKRGQPVLLGHPLFHSLQSAPDFPFTSVPLDISTSFFAGRSFAGLHQGKGRSHWGDREQRSSICALCAASRPRSSLLEIDSPRFASRLDSEVCSSADSMNVSCMEVAQARRVDR